MAKDANIYVRVNQEVKTSAESLFSEFGITITEAINMFLHKSIMVGGIPFDLRHSIPNRDTLKAMREVEGMINNEIPKNKMSVDDFIKEMGE